MLRFLLIKSTRQFVLFCEMGLCQSNPCVLSMESGAEKISMEFPSLDAAVGFLEGMLGQMGTNGGHHHAFSAKITMVGDGKVIVPPIYQTHVFGDRYLYSLDTIPLPGMTSELIQAPVNWTLDVKHA